jgi:hypothetical protein
MAACQNNRFGTRMGEFTKIFLFSSRHSPIGVIRVDVFPPAHLVMSPMALSWPFDIITVLERESREWAISPIFMVFFRAVRLLA